MFSSARAVLRARRWRGRGWAGRAETVGQGLQATLVLQQRVQLSALEAAGARQGAAHAAHAVQLREGPVVRRCRPAVGGVLVWRLAGDTKKTVARGQARGLQYRLRTMEDLRMPETAMKGSSSYRRPCSSKEAYACRCVCVCMCVWRVAQHRALQLSLHDTYIRAG